jgi:hypothetical protein
MYLASRNVFLAHGFVSTGAAVAANAFSPVRWSYTHTPTENFHPEYT